MMKILLLVWTIVLITANMLLLGIVLNFSKNKKDKYSKIGFGFMAAVLVLDMLFTIGGVALW